MNYTKYDYMKHAERWDDKAASANSKQETCRDKDTDVEPYVAQ